MSARESVLLPLKLDNPIYAGGRDVVRFDFGHSRDLSILYPTNLPETVEVYGLAVRDTITHTKIMVQSFVSSFNRSS